VAPLCDWLEIDEDYEPNPCIPKCADDDAKLLEDKTSEAIPHDEDDVSLAWLSVCLSFVLTIKLSVYPNATSSYTQAAFTCHGQSVALSMGSRS
jgi:hypothetical protein